ncbi:MAG: hypothetical protein JWO79_4129 [Actinomycetia bacterium]|nr:hypothetical protein [Actinomycetes bacterium]
MRLTRLTASVAVTLALAGTVTACAAPQMAPKLQLRAASARLDGPQGGVTLSFTGDLDALTGAANRVRTREHVGKMDASTARIYEKIFGSTLTIRYDKGADGNADESFGLAATVAGIEGTELRVVKGVVYAKAPVEDLAVQFGGNRASVRNLAAAAGSNAGVRAALSGRWIAIKLSDLTKDLTNAGGPLAGMPGLTVPARGTLTDAQLAGFSAAMDELFTKASITRDDNDSSHLVATVTEKDLYATLQKLAAATSPGLGSSLKDLVGKSAAPTAKKIAVDLWITDGTLKAVEINLVQLSSTNSPGRAALRIEPIKPAAVTAPTGAVTLDLGSLTN